MSKPRKFVKMMSNGKPKFRMLSCSEKDAAEGGWSLYEEPNQPEAKNPKPKAEEPKEPASETPKRSTRKRKQTAKK